MKSVKRRGKGRKRHGLCFMRFWYYRFLIRMGICPWHEFMSGMDDVIKVLKSFEKFSKNVDMFCCIVGERLGLKFDKDGSFSFNGDSDKILQENRERGMM